MESVGGRTPTKTRKIPVWPTTNTPLESSGFEPETPVGTAARSSHATTGTALQEWNRQWLKTSKGNLTKTLFFPRSMTEANVRT